jgi:CubicO group peptidase (beta-lactamase class C family)
MRRREFLFKSSQAALGCSCLTSLTRAQKDSEAYLSLGPVVSTWEKQIPSLMEKFLVPGLSVAIVNEGKLSWRRGFGVKDSSSNEAVDNDTMFEVASMSKTVFAYAALKLCEKGVIGLDTPLTRYSRKPFLEGDSRLELITARHVLSHTAGFQNWRSDKEPLKIHFTPGERFMYSGEGYSYLQSVVTDVTGQPIEGYMKANLLNPFAMSASGYAWNQTFEKRMARPHDEKGKPLENNRATPEHIARFAAAGELRTTPTDYSKFLVEVLNPKKSDAYRLSQVTREEMVRPQVKIDGSFSWALGWKIQHTKSGDLITHGGHNPGFNSYVAASMERRRGVVIVTNSDNGNQIIRELVSGVTELFLAGGNLVPR